MREREKGGGERDRERKMGAAVHPLYCHPIRE